MKIAICDDSLEWRRVIQEVIDKYFSHNELAKPECIHFDSGESIVASNTGFDILFTDVVMTPHGLDGLTSAKIIADRSPFVKIIVITSYHRCLSLALENKQMIGFISKGRRIDSSELENNLAKAYLLCLNETRKIILKLEHGGTVILNTRDILAVKSDGRKSKVITRNDTYDTKESFSTIKDKLDCEYFFECFRGELINFDYVIRFDKSSIQLQLENIVYTAYFSRNKYSQFNTQYSFFCSKKGIK